jgi:hypothetical protein
MAWNKEMLYCECFYFCCFRICHYEGHQENQEGLELNETNQLLVYADDVSTLCVYTNTVKKNKVLLVTNKEFGLNIKAQRTKCTFTSCHRKGIKNQIKHLKKWQSSNIWEQQEQQQIKTTIMKK